MKITNAHRRNSQIHTHPATDSGVKHTLSLTCECQPDVELIGKTLVATHNMVGAGPDKWDIKVKNLWRFTLGGVQ